MNLTDDLDIIGNRLRLKVKNSYPASNGHKLCVTISVGATDDPKENPSAMGNVYG